MLRWRRVVPPVVLGVLTLGIYVSRLAPSVIPGDPGEYQFVPYTLSIAHPPGYSTYTLVGKLFTLLVPVGTVAWRMNLLAALCATVMVVLVYGVIRSLAPEDDGVAVAAGLVGAGLLAVGADVWQHAVHANAHVMTAMLVVLALFLLVRWARERKGGYWVAFAFVAGLSPAHHPLTVFAFPAYLAFVLTIEPRIWRRWRLILGMAGAGLLGLSAYLYGPVRCALGGPPFGPTDMDTWEGFIRVVTAQGLRVNLFQFGPRELLQRIWDLRVPLGLQYAPWALVLALLGWVWLWKRTWRQALLLTGVAGLIAFATANILQDAMAYLLAPLAVVGVWAGVGADGLLRVARRLSASRQRMVQAGVLLFSAGVVLFTGVVNAGRYDLRDERDADRWLQAVEDRFRGHGEGAILLAEWERMTTVYYYELVEGWSIDAADLRIVPVSAGTPHPFLEAVQAHIGEGPVYLTGYRPAVAREYRLVPDGVFWRVLPAWPQELPASFERLDALFEGEYALVGWRIDRTRVRAGEVLTLDLAMRCLAPTEAYYLPWVRLGETEYRFTTDSRFLTPWWRPEDVVVERFLLPVPWTLSPGEYPLRLGAQWLDGGRDLVLPTGEGLTEPVVWVTVEEPRQRPDERLLRGALGNIGGDVLLLRARVNGHVMPSDEQVVIRPGGTLWVVLTWEALAPVEENRTVFVQLLDMGLRVRAQQDNTPLGGSAPTWLWFPRWRHGTRIVDTYVLQLPDDLEPGTYPLVVGMYGFTSQKRIQTVDAQGNMSGDWITLAHLVVE